MTGCTGVVRLDGSLDGAGLANAASCGGLTVAFEGRLDHRRETLARAPIAAGHDPTDAELVAALHVALGDACLETLAGDYTLAIHDVRTRRLLGARPPLGWRPFYWARSGERVAFGGDPRALLRALALPVRLNEGAIAEHLAARFTTPTDTFWEDVFVLPPGSALEVANGRVRTWRWHRVPDADRASQSDEAHVATFRRMVDAALVEVTRTTGPVVAQLSGGLDSSTVVARATALARAGVIPMPRVVSMRYPGQPYDEGLWSEAVEAHVGVTSVKIDLSAAHDWDDAEAWTARTWRLPLRPNVVSQMVSAPQWRELRPSVVLTGEGGDDWLSGTPFWLSDLLRRGELAQLAALLTGDRIAPGWAKRAGRLWRYGVRPLLSSAGRERLRQPLYRANLGTRTLLRAEWARRVGLVDRWRTVSRSTETTAGVSPVRYAPYVLPRREVTWTNVVAFAADHGFELRHPLHDLPLTHYLARAPGHLFFRDGQKKWLLREAMRGDLPETVRTRSSKANFSPLIAAAIVARLSPADVSRLQLVQRGWIDERNCRAELEGYHAWSRAGGAATLDTTRLNAMWAIVATEIWLRAVTSAPA